MIACVGIGTVTGTIFLVVLLFVAGSISQITESAAGPLLAILYNATANKAGAICLLVYVLRIFDPMTLEDINSNDSISFPLVCMLFATTAIMTTSSRMCFAFARYVAFKRSKRP